MTFIMFLLNTTRPGSAKPKSGAWEIASGCADHYAAWLLNMGAFAIGLLSAPGKVYRAFLRGRSSLNLYKRTLSDELLARYVGRLRTELRLDIPPPKTSLSDQTSFLIWAFISVVVSTTPYLVVLAIIGVLIVKLLSVL